ncbi:citrate lyase acyl carrier protein [Sporanaerobacter acetigenes]|uniref:citrate lyase acyl carrier protein n=1 Tax=Sporanaerobacter acetigenes TaxID=165813 RepID=UPI00105255D2|nr:citrate lyase acyl carrier protein [Sporanaerobacter acetigenes]
MEEIKTGQAGSLESNDLIVTVNLNEREDLCIEIESIVKEKFGKQIEKVVRETLKEFGVNNGYIKIVDKGALDFTIRARLKTAIKRAERRQ